MQHGWWNQQMPDLRIITNIPPATSLKPLNAGGAISYLALTFSLIKYTGSYLVATYNSETALRRRDPTTNKTVYTTVLPTIEFVENLEGYVGLHQTHVDVSSKS